MYKKKKVKLHEEYKAQMGKVEMITCQKMHA